MLLMILLMRRHQKQIWLLKNLKADKRHFLVSTIICRIKNIANNRKL